MTVAQRSPTRLLHGPEKESKGEDKKRRNGYDPRLRLNTERDCPSPPVAMALLFGSLRVVATVVGQAPFFFFASPFIWRREGGSPGGRGGGTLECRGGGGGCSLEKRGGGTGTGRVMGRGSRQGTGIFFPPSRLDPGS